MADAYDRGTAKARAQSSQARELLLDAVPRSGTFLDVGAANGHLMECLAPWARERGLELVVYGLELNPALLAMARHRLPALADRLYTGNVIDWTPPRRFTYVRIGLEYVPPARAPFLIERVLTTMVEPEGRLLVGPVNDGQRRETTAAFMAPGVPAPGEVSSTDRTGKMRFVFWTTAGNRGIAAGGDHQP